jgi:hypothetical protein
MEEEMDDIQSISYPYGSPDTKDDSRKKGPTKIIIASIIVVTIVLLSVIVLFFNFGPPEISHIYVSLSESQSNHLDVTVLAGSNDRGSLAGDADLDITYNSNIILTSKIPINEDGTGYLNLKYNSFIEGNGNYDFQCSYRGTISPPETYNVNYLVERLSLFPSVGVVSDEGQLNITTFMLEEDGRNMGSNPEDALFEITQIVNLDSNEHIQTQDTPVDIEESFIINEFPYNKSGNYAITAKVTNTRAKITSDFYEVFETLEAFLNIPPIAKATLTISNNESLPNYTGHFDASESWNDGEITKYIWDFNNDGIIDLQTDEPYANYSGYVKGNDYVAVLNVQGDELIDEFLELYEKGALRISVETP